MFWSLDTNLSTTENGANNMTTYYRNYGMVQEDVKIFTGEATVGDNGKWEINYAHVGFRDIHTVQSTPIYALDDSGQTPTGSSVYFSNTREAHGLCMKGTSLGLIVGSANLWANKGTKINVTVIGI